MGSCFKVHKLQVKITVCDVTSCVLVYICQHARGTSSSTFRLEGGFSILKKETSLQVYPNTWRHIPADNNIHSHHFDDIKD